MGKGWKAAVNAGSHWLSQWCCSLITAPKTDFDTQLFFFIHAACKQSFASAQHFQVLAAGSSCLCLALYSQPLALPLSNFSLQPRSGPNKCIRVTPGLWGHVAAMWSDLEVGEQWTFLICSFARISHHSFCSELQLTVTRLEKAKGSVSEEQLHLPPCQPLQLGNLKLI